MKVGDDFVLELFHGPTAAFKDVALSMLPQLVTAARGQEGVEDKIVILTATSGDTGKAALEGFHDVEGTGIIVFFPDEGVSPVQKAQMVTQAGANVKVCAVRGNFDDCQTGVKRAFAAARRERCARGHGPPSLLGQLHQHRPPGPAGGLLLHRLCRARQARRDRLRGAGGLRGADRQLRGHPRRVLRQA